jgi:sulfide:quinone oxidoreductase
VSKGAEAISPPAVPPIEPRSIVIVGGGVGAVEALLALTDLGEHQFTITVVAPNERFVLPALSVAQPFAAGHHADVASLADLVREQGAELVHGTVTQVDTDDLTVTCSDGQTLVADVIVLSPGAVRTAPYEQTFTFGLGDPLALTGVLADLEEGYSTSIAFVVPDGVAWSLPLYELALLTARVVDGVGRDVDIVVATPEPVPLAVFGAEASASVAALLDELGITVYAGMPVTVKPGSIQIGPDSPLAMDRIVTLPVLEGPHVAGVRANSAGFIPVDGFCRLPGAPGVYAIGDATALVVKQGGLACQQADVVAQHVAQGAGGPLEAEPFSPVLRGRLLTGGADRFLRRDLREPQSESADIQLWWPPAKVYGHYLSAWVAQRRPGDVTSVAARVPSGGIDIDVPLDDPAWPRQGPLALETLGAMWHGRSSH